MATIVEKNHGIFIDFQGDSVMTKFFGNKHALHAVESAVQQQELLHLLRAYWKSREAPQVVLVWLFGCLFVCLFCLFCLFLVCLVGCLFVCLVFICFCVVQFFVRMGLNSGRCLVGTVGSLSHMKYTCIGDNVNLASRLEGLSRFYGVSMVLSFSTFSGAETRERFVARCLDYVLVVGKAKPTMIFTVIARRAAATQLQLDIETLSLRAVEQFCAKQVRQVTKQTLFFSDHVFFL
jgi:class 3 adenylate cyclase